MSENSGENINFPGICAGWIVFLCADCEGDLPYPGGGGLLPQYMEVPPPRANPQGHNNEHSIRKQTTICLLHVR